MIRTVTAISAAFLALVLLLSTGSPRSVSARSGPSADSDLTRLAVKGLSAPVTVHYDQRGIPYIEARNDNDLYFAQGYTVARDRLWQMDLTRRLGRGELAEIFGKVALDEDKIHRTYGFGQLAEQMVARLNPKARAAVEAYARGVNAYIESLDDKTLPIEFRLLRYKPTPWTASDCLVVGKVFAETLSSSWHYDIVRAAFAGVPPEKRDQIFPTRSSLDVILEGNDRGTGAPKAARQAPSASFGAVPSRRVLDESSRLLISERQMLRRVGFYAEDMAASNNWVVSGSRSVTGKPLLANDPHLSPSAPSVWYMISLSEPGFHCAGVTVAGAPGIFIGHNDRVAWGITNVEADVQDVFLEKFDPSHPNRYQTPNGWRDAEIRHEEIKVRKAPADPATETQEFDVTVTRHGPVVLDKDGKRYALAWPALDPTTKELEAFYNIDRTRSCREFEAALKDYSGFPLNFVFADVEGHIGWWAQGRYPIRKTGRGTVPQDGWTGAGDWTGYVPASETPHILDPRSGIIVTANQRTVGTSYPYYLGDLWGPPYRARRIYELLTAKAKLSVDDFERIQGDTYSIPGMTFAREVVKMAKPLASSSADWSALLKEFEDWDGKVNADSRAALLETGMRNSFFSQIIKSAFGADLAKAYNWPDYDLFIDHMVTEQPKEWLPKEYGSYQDFILACYKQVTGNMKKRLGPDESKWTWGSMVKTRFPHPLSGAPFVGGLFMVERFPQNGGPATVNRGSEVSMRFIADMSNWDNTRQGIALGESGDPKSPHWKDQLEDWRNVTPAVFPFSPKAVESTSKQELLMKPK